MSAFPITPPAAAGGVRVLLRLEGFALLLGALALYAQSGASWTLFAILFLVPDLSFAFYLFGTRIGAIAYNAVHSTLGPILLVLASRVAAGQTSGLLPIALIWFAHIGFDRALGYGLKYASGFGDTHLSRLGRA